MDIRILSLILTQRERDEFNLTRFIMRHLIRIHVSESCTVRCDISARLQTDAIKIESVFDPIIMEG